MPDDFSLPTKPKGRVGRPPSLSVEERKQRELDLKESGLALKKEIHKNRKRETEQKEELLEILRSIDNTLTLLTAVIGAAVTGKAIQTIQTHKDNNHG